MSVVSLCLFILQVWFVLMFAGLVLSVMARTHVQFKRPFIYFDA